MNKKDFPVFNRESVSDPRTRMYHLEALRRYIGAMSNFTSRAIHGPVSDLGDFLVQSREIQKPRLIETTADDIPSSTTIQKPLRGPLTKEMQSILAIMNREAALQSLQMYLDLYMAPGQVGDVRYRLGEVTGIKPNAVRDVLKNTNMPLTSPQTNGNGQMWTPSNLYTNFTVKYLSSSASILQQTFPYINYFFPPYKSVSTQTKFGGLAKETKPGASTKYDLSDVKTYDTKTQIISRPDYTYRTPGFKAINDNIMLMQFLFEQLTGIVSTYLTEWDLSIYMQEGLTNPGTSMIYLLHRVPSDNPMGISDDRSFSFAVVNAAVSKLFNHCNMFWEPSDFPLSSLWLRPEVNTIDINLNNEIIKVPDFYITGLGDFNNNSIIIDNIRLMDRKYAALSSWAEWQLLYFKAFYTSASDGLTEADIAEMTAYSEGITQAQEIKINMQRIIDQGGIGSMVAASSMFPSGGGSSYSNGSTSPVATGNLPGDNTSFRGEDKSKSSGTTSSALNAAQKTATGYANSSGFLSSSGGGPNGIGDPYENDPQKSKGKKAPTIGIPQFNPVLYGGPHGANFSPHSIQGYFERDNAFLRNTPRVSGNTYSSFTNSSPAAYNNGNDRFYYSGGPEAEPDFGLTDHSPAYALHRLIKGESTYTWATGYSEKDITERFQGVITQGRTACSAWPSFTSIKAPAGATTGLTWHNDLHYDWIEGWQANTFWNGNYWFGSYYLYWNKFSYSYWKWNGNTWQWYVRTYAPFRSATYTIRAYDRYKRYTMVSYPTLKWRIGQINNPIVTINVSYFSSWWGGFWSWFWGGFSRRPTYTVTFKNNIRYRVFIEGSQQERDFDYGGLKVTHSTGEMDVMRKMIAVTPASTVAGHENYLIFCEGTGQSYASRMINGPKSMFKSKVCVKTYNTVYREWKWRRSRHVCHWDWYSFTVPRVTSVAYIDIDLADVEWFREHLDTGPWTNLTQSDPFTTYMNVPTTAYRRKNTVVESLFPSGGNTVSILNASTGTVKGQLMTSTRYTIEGYGILSSIQGLSSDAGGTKEDEDQRIMGGMTALEYLNLGGRKNAPNMRTVRINALPRYTVDFAGFQADTDKVGYPGTVIGGIPKYIKGKPYDAGLKKAIARMYTTATFYKVGESQPYSIGIDAPFRVLANQLLWQVSFMETIIRLLLVNNGGIDFQTVYNIAKTCLDSDMLTVSNPENTSTYDPSSMCYRYWIDRAFRIFAPSQWATGKANLRRSLESRIATYTTAINNFRPLMSRTADNWTLEECQNAFAYTIQVARIAQQKQDVDDFMFAYMNVLYEYRKYFINKRFNKQDGSMWMVRQMESVLPMLEQTAFLEQMPSIEEAMEGGDSGIYDVAAYDIQNTLDMKAKAIRGQISPLDPDKIIRLYITVNYGTEDDYNKNPDAYIPVYQPIYKTQRFDDGNEAYVKPLQKTGEVFRGYAKLPKDGHYYLESKERIENENNLKLNATIPKDKKQNMRYTYDIDFAHWPIKWGNTATTTPIFFGAFMGLDISKMMVQQQEGLGNSDDVMANICSCQKTSDFWTVYIPKASWPRTVGYVNELKIKPYYVSTPKETPLDKVLYAVAGVMAYSLYPVTEDQAKIEAGNMVGEVVEALKTTVVTSRL
jgi:hypothetical protein